ncbi:MAG: alcohol dehydrogenase catalytic domain-containing protein [Nitrospinaceae bacterium]|jgi:L-iditol 2-dehydrogenase|nr:alcohol dehydrogenase catalytic domain-containing protein [Nitrospinaceae bacterium]
MKAVVLKDNKILKLEDFPEANLRSDECQVAIQSACVCSSDIYRAFFEGAYFYPLVMGHEMAGEVISCGLEAGKRFKPGDRVGVFPLIPCQSCAPCHQKDYAQCCSYDYYGSRRHGGFAQRLNIRSWNLLPLPGDVSFDDASLLEPMSVVIHALSRADLLGVSGSEEVAILGGGTLGLLAVQILQKVSPSLSVTVFDRNRYKLNIAKSWGANIELLDGGASWDEYVSKNSKRFPYILQASDGSATFRYSIKLAKQLGSIVWMGNIASDLSLPKDYVSDVLRQELNIMGTWNSRYDPETQNDWTMALDLLQAGIRPSKLINRTVSLLELPEVLGNLYSHKRGSERHDILKVQVRPNLTL